MKRVLGLDIGVSGIGTAYLEFEEYNEIPLRIELGSRVLALEGEESEFKKGQPQTKNAQRRLKKGVRKGNKRYKQRRNKLVYVLQRLNLLPDFIQPSGDFNNPIKIQKINILPIKKESNQLTGKDFIELKVKALNEKISSEEFGRILYRFNQLRGYAGGNEYEDDQEDVDDVLGLASKNKSHPTIENKVLPFKVISVSKTSEYKKKKILYNLITEDEEGQEWIGTTLVNSLSEGEIIELKRTIRRKATSNEITSREFSIPNKTNWRKKMENFEDALTKLSEDSGREIYLSEYLLELLKENEYHRIRDNVILRSRYIKEFDKIWDTQFKYHLENVDKKTIKEIAFFLFPGESITQKKYRDEAIEKGLKHILRNQIIYYQRNLKDQSHLISDCRFEKNEKAVGKSHPLFQEYKVWEQINKLNITRKTLIGQKKNGKNKYKYEDRPIPVAFKEYLFKELNTKSELSFGSVFKALKKRVDFEEGVDFFNGMSTKGKLKGNKTKLFLKKRLGDFYEILNIEAINNQIEIWDLLYNSAGNEYDLNSNRNKEIKEYLLKKGIAESDDFNKIVVAISKIKFPREYASISLKVVKKTLPLIRVGSYYNISNLDEKLIKKIETILNQPVSDAYDKSLQKYLDQHDSQILIEGGFVNAFALMLIYGRHTAKEIKGDDLYSSYNEIRPLERHSLRSPIVEQIVNEVKMLVKDVWRKYGRPTEIRVELARELKNSINERKRIEETNQKNYKLNNEIKNILSELNEELSKGNIEKYKLWQSQKNNDEEYVRKYEATKNEVEKLKLWKEQGHIDPYTGQPIPLSHLFNKGLFDVDHIIPQSRYFDDSFTNKVICSRKVNDDKGNRTAMEYMEIGSQKCDILTQEIFIENASNQFFGRKRKMLLATEIPDDPISRQIKDTQFISIKVKEELAKIVGTDNVKTTTGGVTHYLRNHWGLTNVFKEILKERFIRFHKIKAKKEAKEKIKELYNPKEYTKEFLDNETLKLTNELSEKHIKENIYYKNNHLIIKGYSKRFDHRHHALDALIVACTSQKAIKRLNDLNKHLKDWLKKNHNKFEIDFSKDVDELLENFLHAEEKIRKEIIKDLERFKNVERPWKSFNKDVKEALEKITISHKPKDKLLLQFNQKGNRVIKIRGALHKETIYGLSQGFETTKIQLSKFADSKFATEKNIAKIVDKELKEIITDHFFSTFKKKKKDAFGAEGLLVLNKRLKNKTAIVNGKLVKKPHPPINSVKVYRKEVKPNYKITLQKLQREKSYNNSIYVDTQSNYLFAVLEKEGERIYDHISLFDAVDYLKTEFNSSDDRLNFSKETSFKNYFEDKNNGKVLFILKQLDMVYLPNENEDAILDKQSPLYKDFWQDKERNKNIYIVVKIGKQTYFRKHDIANVIENKIELGSQNAEEIVEGRKIAEYCFPITLDRLGNIINTFEY